MGGRICATSWKVPTTDHRNTMTSLSAWMKFHPYAEAAATPAVGEHTSHRFGIRRGSRKRWLPYVPTHYHGIFHRQLAFFFFRRTEVLDGWRCESLAYSYENRLCSVCCYGGCRLCGGCITISNRDQRSLAGVWNLCCGEEKNCCRLFGMGNFQLSLNFFMLLHSSTGKILRGDPEWLRLLVR